MDATEWTYKEFSGPMHDGEPGYYLGYDADGQPYIVKWCKRSIEEAPGGFWIAVSLDDHSHNSAEPIVHALVGNNASKIVKWASLPLRWSELERGTDKAQDTQE